MSFIHGKKKGMSRLVRIFGKDKLEEIFGSQVTIAMLWPLRFHRLCRERLKKTGRKDWCPPNKYGLKYGIRVPRNTKEDAQFDRDNDNLL